MTPSHEYITKPRRVRAFRYTGEGSIPEWAIELVEHVDGEWVSLRDKHTNGFEPVLEGEYVVIHDTGWIDVYPNENDLLEAVQPAASAVEVFGHQISGKVYAFDAEQKYLVIPIGEEGEE